MSDPRETTHMPCDCVPDLGPEHCHLCSAQQGCEIAWAECTGPKDTETENER
jgi:hypothetical protein